MEDALTALVASLLGWLHGLTAGAACPGGWPWAVSALGVGVGLLPAAGAAAVALWRRRIGSRYGPAESVVLAGTGLLAAGVAPLLVFVATGRVFAAAADGSRVPGLSSGELRSLGARVCRVGPQGDYLGEGTVAGMFGSGDPLRLGFALLALVGMPLVAALFTAASALLALRRGPRWPARLFWLPLLSVAVLTRDVPPGAAGHLWVGAAAGAVLGVPMVFAMGRPGWAVVHRSTAGPVRSGPDRSAAPAGVRGPAVGRGGASAGAAPRPTAGAAVVPSAAGAAGGRWRRGWGGRLAERFAARAPEPLVGGPTAVGARHAPPVGLGRAPVSGGGPTRTGGPSPTLVAPAGAVVPGGPGDRVPVDGAFGSGRAAPPRFRLIRRLGSGGFGRVWLAHDGRLGHTVALKAAHVRDADTEERIRREAEALAAVRHPNCVQIHDLVAADGDPGLAELEGMVIVMEYVRGRSLGEMVGEHAALDDVAAARMWCSIAGALDAAHARGVLHRDVKPANIVVDADGQAHLIDFGIARRAGDATLTAVGFVLGTPDFLAPEVACGGRATPQSDSWQLAATVSYALTGHPPRGGHTDAVAGLRVAALGGPPTHLPQRSAHLRLLRAALADDPAQRPPLRAVQAALEAWLRSVGARADGPVATGTSGR